MDERVVVRRATATDLLPALVWLRAAWRGDEVTDTFAEDFRRWYDREGDQRWWWLAEDAGQAVGMVNLRLFDRMPSPVGEASRWGYLANLYVVPTSRGRAVGGRLVDALLRTAEADGLVRVVLSPSEPSVPLYERLGFVRADRMLVRKLR